MDTVPIDAVPPDAVPMNAASLLAELDAHFRLLWITTGIIIAAAILLGALFFINRYTRKKQRSAVEYSRNIRTAQEAERAIIARELHDSVITGLRRLSFLAYAKDGAAREDAAPLAPLPDRINAECDALIRRVREICRSLIPPDLLRLGLRGSLENLCAAVRETAGANCRLIAPPDLDALPLGPDSAFHCYRIIQEALANAEKHAAAAEISVVIRREGPVLIALVSDNGKGYRPAAAPDGSPSGGLGIAGMYDRAAIIGGTLSFESESGAGTLVRLELPLEADHGDLQP